MPPGANVSTTVAAEQRSPPCSPFAVKESLPDSRLPKLELKMLSRGYDRRASSPLDHRSRAPEHDTPSAHRAQQSPPARRPRPLPDAVEHGRDILGDAVQATTREFLVTNGAGSYASSSLAGTLTRSYHGLLIAALQPPVGRTLLVSALDDVATYLGSSYALAPHAFVPREAHSTDTATPVRKQGRVEAAVLNTSAAEARARRQDALEKSAPRGASPPAAAAELLESFRLEGTMPVFTYGIADALLEKRIWLKRGENAVFVRYKLLRASRPLALSIDAVVNHRDHHARTEAARPPFIHNVTRVDSCVVVDFRTSENGCTGADGSTASPEQEHDKARTRLVLKSTRGQIRAANTWLSGGVLDRERERGLPPSDDHLHAATLSVELLPGSTVTIVAAAVRDKRGPPVTSNIVACNAAELDLPPFVIDLSGDDEMEEQMRYEADLLDRFYFAREARRKQRRARHEKNHLGLPASHSLMPATRLAWDTGSGQRSAASLEQSLTRNPQHMEYQAQIEQLVLAADQFVVERSMGKSIIAGWHWFQDYSRDTFIALPGLAIVSGRLDVARDVLLTWSKFVSRGMLPNRFPESGSKPDESDFNTADGSLWYFESVRAYYTATNDLEFVREVFPVLCSIIAHHVSGTRFGIRQDPEDGLLRAGADGVSLTWMDAVCERRVFTPRKGKPVELAALWFNALSVMSIFAADLDLDGEERKFSAMADATEKGFRRFWNEEQGYCYDVLDTGPSQTMVDATLRPNQLLACSLQWSPLSNEQHMQVVSACAQYLYAAHGIRTLPQDAPGYRGKYEGGVYRRDEAYHNGTSWAWLIGPFVTAHLRAYGDRKAARAFLTPLLRTLGSAGQGTLSEIFDGDAPYRARGCIAQAWSVGELLRAYVATEPDSA